MIYNDEEIFYSPKYINNKIIDKIIKNPKIKKVILPKSHYEIMLKKNPNGVRRLLLAGIDIEPTSKKGRPKKITEEIKQEILELYKKGYTILEISKLLKIPKSTIWDYVGVELIKYKESKKIEQLWELVYAYKEKLIEEGLFDSTVEMMFLELEMYIKNNNLNKAKETLIKIINYVKEGEDD